MNRHATQSARLRILLSAYACLPDHGSEPGIGWDWSTRLAAAGHEVWVLTLAYNRPGIERALRGRRGPLPRFVYYDLPLRRPSRVPAGWMRLHYALWQFGAYWVARRLCRGVRFDVIHHLTYGVFRQVSFLAFLGVPFVFGPVGGGESAPHALRRTFPWRGYLQDLARDAANIAVRFDPLMGAVFRRSALTLCKTGETLRQIPAKYRDRCLLHLELGTDRRDTDCAAARPEGGLRVLYVGRLVYWKGLHLGLMAFAQFRRTHPDASLTVIGSGNDGPWMHELAQRLELGPSVRWIPRLARPAVMRAYARHDAFLFPSLHDSSGNVVLEALSCGLPVICVDTGGPAAIVDASCGYAVPAGDAPQVVGRMAAALAELADDRAAAAAKRAAAARRAQHQYSWERQIARMEDIYSFACGRAALPGHVGA